MSSPRSWRRRFRTVALSPLLLIAALWLLVEEYLWARLEPALRRLSALRLVARLEAVIAGLPPWGALPVFAGPILLLFPIKLLALWVIAKGAYVAGLFLFVGLEVMGAALGARIFMLTRPSLMRLIWFRVLYDWFMIWRGWMHAWLDEQPLWIMLATCASVRDGPVDGCGRGPRGYAFRYVITHHAMAWAERADDSRTSASRPSVKDGWQQKRRDRASAWW